LLNHSKIAPEQQRSPARQATFERWLLVLFVLTIPLVNPWIRGDGVGYYAFARAPLIEHSFDFVHDYQSANDSFRDARLDANGLPKAEFRTRTGHLDNHFTVGPALLWAPFLAIAQAGVLLARSMGSQIAADGFSAPYRFAFAFATALYGFLGLLLAMRLATVYVGVRWAFISTLSIWWASSLPVYMYFNPSWSHAHSAFAVSLFLWYWNRTREQRTLKQWCLLALIAGLMLNVYYVNAMLLIVLVFDAFADCLSLYGTRLVGGQSTSESKRATASRLFTNYFFFCLIVTACLTPTFITRYIVYGNPFESGYGSIKSWAWTSPHLLQVLFSSDHGLFVWTPVTMLAVAGLFLFSRRQPGVGVPLLAASVAFYLFIACYPDWAGISSYGNRFFVSLTPLFIVGLGVLLEQASRWIGAARLTRILVPAVLGCVILWNLGFMFQWGTHLVPSRGAISWNAMIHNQFFVVPRDVSTKLGTYLFHRAKLMEQIENSDIQELQQQTDP
jgi:hypothetical protein